jgi:hypothetical protein
MITAYALQIFLALTAVISVIYAVTAYVLFKKYVRRKNRLHFWAATAFVLLLIQEIIVTVWMVSHLAGTSNLLARPFYLQAISVFFSLMLLGFAMTGKIHD